MDTAPTQMTAYVLWSCVLLAVGITPCMSFAQGGERVVYQGSHSTGKYHVKITAKGAFSEKSTSWYMDVSSKGNQTVMADYVFSPFYAWTCVMRGKAQWVSDSVLHFKNLSAQGRTLDLKLKNKTGAPLPYTEVWVRSVDRKGYPHSPSICLFFDIKNKEEPVVRPEVFPGAEYFMVRCESQGKAATSYFRVPARKGWPHDIDLDDRKKRLIIELVPSGPLIDGGAFEELTPQERKVLVPDGRRLHLSEDRREPFRHLGDKIQKKQNKPSRGDVQ